MRVWIHGEGSVNLGQGDFVAAGGEGSVYARGDTAYKVYADPKRAIPEDKLRELAGIRHPGIIKPTKLLVDKAGTPVGYTMPFVRDTLPLCQLFPRVYKEAHGLTPDKVGLLVSKLRDGVQSVHDAGALIVDLNEMNFLVDRSYSEVYFIDVDSYQTAHYPATALMASVRDWKVSNNDWTPMSDWFSFAVVAFTLFTGLHPYKGKHPSLKGFEARMKADVSVFNSAVRVPKAAYPIEVIPADYRDWMFRVLEQGERSAPPGVMGRVRFTPIVKVLNGINVLLSEVQDYRAALLGFSAHRGRSVAWTTSGVWMDNRRVHGPVAGVRGVAFTPRTGNPVLAGVAEGKLSLFDVVRKAAVSIDIRADDVMSYAGDVYFRMKSKILRLRILEMGGKIIASTQVAGTCMEHATQMFPGAVIQNLLGRTFVSLFPEAGQTFQAGIPELDNYRIVDAKFDGGVLMVIGMSLSGKDKGQYNRLVFRFAEHFDSHDVRVVEDIQPAGLNFVCLPTGVCVCIDEEERLEVFSKRKDSPALKQISDPALRSDMRLTQKDGQVVFPQGAKLLSMRMN